MIVFNYYYYYGYRSAESLGELEFFFYIIEFKLFIYLEEILSLD